MQIIRLLVLCISLILILGCNSDREFRRNHLLTKEEMVNVLVDINLANGLQGSPEFYKISRVYDSVDIISNIFDKYDIEKASFDSSIAYYTRRPEVFIRIYDEVIMRISQIQDTVKMKK